MGMGPSLPAPQVVPGRAPFSMGSTAMTRNQARMAMPAAAAMSLMMPIFSLWRVSTKSHRASTVVLNNSAANTMPVASRITAASTQACSHRADTSTSSDSTIL